MWDYIVLCICDIKNPVIITNITLANGKYPVPFVKGKKYQFTIPCAHGNCSAPQCGVYHMQ